MAFLVHPQSVTVVPLTVSDKMDFSGILNFFISLFTLHYRLSFAELVVNVRNDGGEVIQETIQSETSSNTIKLFFRKFDGTMIAQFIDFDRVRYSSR